jgi:hypothetical protein
MRIFLKIRRGNMKVLRLFLVVFFASALFTMAQSDTTPPTLLDLYFSPDSIDVTTAPATVDVTIEVIDDLAGYRNGFIIFSSPSGKWRQGNLVTPNDSNEYTVTMPFSQYIESGTWSVLTVALYDKADNEVFLNTDYLEAHSFPTTLEVDSNPDTTSPVVTGMTISPSTVDVSSGPVDVTFTISATDVGGSGLASNSNLSICFPSDTRLKNIIFPIFIDGDPNDGIYQGKLTIPQYVTGEWEVALNLYDNAGNLSSYAPFEVFPFSSTAEWPPDIPHTISVSSTPPDMTPPQLLCVSLSQTEIDTTNGPQTVYVTLELQDDPSGVPPSMILNFPIQSPSGKQVVGIGFVFAYRIEGDDYHGKWRFGLQFPQYSETGTWQGAASVALGDRSFNTYPLGISPEDLGFPIEIVVNNPSLASDGSIGSAGGTISDETFGSRAQITLPEAAAEDGTLVSVDVLADPSNVPLPAGVSATETYFVNILLNPELQYPIPLPGITAVLPMKIWRMPDTPINLYRIDQDTGDLVPALDVYGQPVVGMVDSDGWTATFSGIAHLSTIVGLIPESIQVPIDIKPGSFPNSINLGSNGTVPVAILSGNDFDATTVIPTSIELAGSSVALKGKGTPMASEQDVNGDGLIDLVVHVNTEALTLSDGDVSAVLIGETYDSYQITGLDSVRIVPPVQ